MEGDLRLQLGPFGEDVFLRDKAVFAILIGVFHGIVELAFEAFVRLCVAACVVVVCGVLLLIFWISARKKNIRHKS